MSSCDAGGEVKGSETSNICAAKKKPSGDIMNRQSWNGSSYCVIRTVAIPPHPPVRACILARLNWHRHIHTTSSFKTQSSQFSIEQGANIFGWLSFFSSSRLVLSWCRCRCYILAYNDSTTTTLARHSVQVCVPEHQFHGPILDKIRNT